VNTRCWTVPGAWLAVSLLWAASAEAAGVPVRVYYRAPADCGSAESFLSHLVARNPEARLAGGAEPAFALSVVLEPRATDVVGALYLSDPAGFRTVRVVPGQNCDDVVAALALVAAVLTNPHAVEAPPPMAPPASVSPAPSPPPRKRNWWAGGGAGVGLLRAAAPRLSPSPSFELVGGFETESVLSPFLSIGLHYARSSAPNAAGWAGWANFGWTAGRLVGCPIQWPSKALLGLRPCAMFEAGKLTVSGRGATGETHSHELPWWATGLLVRAEFRPLEPLAIVAEAGVVIPLLSDNFYFQNGDSRPRVFQVPPVAMDGRLGLVARVW
jgi:hypothetical protein